MQMLDDAVPGLEIVPQWNTLVHFQVPRWHSVTPVRSSKQRYALYGWVLVPRVHLLHSESELREVTKRHRVVAVARTSEKQSSRKAEKRAKT